MYYYHCTRRHPTSRCGEPSIELRELERQILAFLERLAVPERLHRWLLDRIAGEEGDIIDVRVARRRSLEEEERRLSRELENLTSLRVRDLIDDKTFVRDRRERELELLKVQQSRANISSKETSIEPLKLLISFSNSAAMRFQNADSQGKRLILQLAGSNPRLQGKKVSIDAAKPFRAFERPPSFSCLLPDRESNPNSMVQSHVSYH